MAPAHRPPGPTQLQTSTQVLTAHTLDDPHGIDKRRRPSPSAGSPAAALSSALRPPADSLLARGGSPHNLQAFTSHAPSSLGLTNLVALDLDVPTPGIEVADLSTPSSNGTGGSSEGPGSPSSRSSGSGASGNRARRQRHEVDKGYSGDTIQDKVRADLHLGVPGKKQLGPRDYLSGPVDELVIPLPRPSPLSRPNSPLPSPAVSIASASTPGVTLPNGCADEEQNFLLPHIASPSGEYPDGDEGCDENGLPIITDSTPSRPRPRAFTLSHSAFGSFGTFPSTARAGPLAPPTLKSRVKLFFLQLLSNTASTAFLVFIIIWALASRFLAAIIRTLKGQHADRTRREWDTDEAQAERKQEKVTKDIRYYALRCGFDVVEQTVETKDGYLLKMFKVVCLKKKEKVHSDGRKGFPVLIQHGLFQSCGSFITSEERSLAFWLAEHGDYQVYLGNARGVFEMGHSWLKRSDPRFWDYNIKELALYDLPAMVDHVRRDTGYDKIAFIGHSQGNATMFCALAQGMVPELGEKLSLFIALAPAVYAGPLTTGFPFSAIKSMKWKTWRRWFGVLDFIPLMRISYNWVPSRIFGLLGYQMFAFLFNWTDANWLLDRKAKKFCFMPSPVSSASVFWWTGYNGFSTRGCILDTNADKWFDKRFPPLAIHHGGKDYLVLTEPLLERLEKQETDVQVIRVQKMDDGEHCDFFWHIDAVELCFHSFLEDIERTRPRYPEERRRSHSPQPPAHSPRPSRNGTAADVKELKENSPLEDGEVGRQTEMASEGERRDVKVKRTAEGY
ncbi:Alpha/Beta hydrolase fold [Rhodotorula toruloides]|uniref:Alpha/Beta hydrolase fold n=1 Tax=Rhodotorula toruloides TaxID=5286 RepID=A0A2T0AB35_RHOTO|nr:Alpha/Beta hydrolase fold [Rhodotorula toruloides]PRQ75225.1 Alpha/Beta hydrolase fold [Rhodotorula toruloides]